jgi:hypothetical protein
MSWINARQFSIANSRNGTRHYVFRRTNAGNTEINIPKNITTKGKAIAWLKANPNKVKNPTSFKAKRSPLKGVQAPGLRPFERIINGKKMIAFATKNGKTRYSPVRAGLVRAVALAPPKANRNYKCNTQFYKRVRNSNGATGFNSTLNQFVWHDGKAIRKHLYTINNRRIPVTKGLGKLGKGTQGRVFLAYTTPKGDFPVTIKVIPHDKEHRKQSADTEFAIQKRLYKIIPGSIPEPYKILHDCKEFIPASSWAVNNKKANIFNYKDQTVTFTEYINGGSLPNWMNRMSSQLDDNFMQNLISQVLHILAFIQKRIPSFRHNDLHLDNILVKMSASKYPTYILNDFGWASIGPKSNPLVNGAKHAGTFGIGPLTSGRYDMHLFLNELHKWMQTHGGRAKFPKAFAFIEKYLPDGYRGSTNKHISESRLKYGDKAPALPTLRDIIRDSYVKAPKNIVNNTYNFLKLSQMKNKMTKNNIEKILKSNSVTPRKRAIAQGKKNIMNEQIKNPTWMSPVYAPTNSNKKRYLSSSKKPNPYNAYAGYEPPHWKAQYNNLQKLRKRTHSPATPANNGGSKRRKTSSRKKATKSVNRNRTSPKKLNFSPYKNMKLSPRSFLKLSPRSRAAMMVKPRGMPGQSHAILVVNKSRRIGSNTVRPMFVMKASNNVPRLPFGMGPKPRPSPVKVSPKKSPNFKPSASMLRSAKFNALRVKLTSPSSNMTGKNYQDRWNRAKIKAINFIANRVKRGLSPFPATPAKPAAQRRNSPPPAPAPRNRSPVNARLAALLERTKKANRRSKYRTTYTPKTGRMKIEGNKGRLSYVNGTGVSLAYLKNIAAKYGVNISGLRSKESIANKIFRNNK